MVDMFHCFTEQITWRKSGELGTGGDPAGNLYIVWTNYNYKIADERRSKKEKEQSNLEEKNAYEEKINKQIYEITKLTLSKISNISASEAEIKEMVTSTQEKANH